jgi:hypothetical protein
MLVTERPAERKSAAAAMLIHNFHFSGEKKVAQLGQNISGLRMYILTLRRKK